MEITMSLAVQVADAMTVHIRERLLELKDQLRKNVNELLIKKIEDDELWLVLYKHKKFFTFSRSIVLTDGKKTFRFLNAIEYPVVKIGETIEISSIEMSVINSLNEQASNLTYDINNKHTLIILELLKSKEVDRVKDLYPEAYPYLMDCLKKK